MQRLPPLVQTAFLTLLAPTMWGTSYVVITELLPQGRPFLIASGRVLPASIVLIAIGWMRSRWRPRGPEWRHIALISVFNFSVFFPLLITGIYLLPGGVAAAVGGVQPLLVALVAWILLGERPKRLQLLVGVVAALGVSLVVLRPDAAFSTVGLLASLGANVSFAIGVVLTKKQPAPPSRIAATGWQMLLGSVVLIPLSIVIEDQSPSVTTTNLLGFAYLSLVATGLGYYLWFSGIQRLPVAAPPLLGLSSPITGATMGWLILGEDLTALQLLGFAITISAVAYGALVVAAKPELLRSKEGISSRS